MGIQKPDERLKVEREIFDLYNKCLDKSAPDLDKIHGRLWSAIKSWDKKWNIDYQFRVIDLGEEDSDIGMEIYIIICKFSEAGKYNIPKNIEGFFSYLRTSIKNEVAMSNRKEAAVRVPWREMAKVRKIKQLKKMREVELGRLLTKNEYRELISEWMNIANYLEIINLGFPLSLESKSKNDDEEERSVLDTKQAKNVFEPGDSIDDPQEKYKIKYSSLQMARLKSAVQEIYTEDIEDSTCNKALFTLYCCIDEESLASLDLYYLHPILDNEILDNFIKTGEKPNQYEIIMKYKKSITTKDSAMVKASQMWKLFRSKLSRKYPDLKPKNIKF